SRGAGGGDGGATSSGRGGGRRRHSVLVGSVRLPLTPFDLVSKILIDRTPMRSLEQQFAVRSGGLSAPFRAELNRFDDLYVKARQSGFLDRSSENRDMGNR
ncbi:MAG: hypothetical protein ABT940_09760, partial [Alphaproteobacteria bacterium]